MLDLIQLVDRQVKFLNSKKDIHSWIFIITKEKVYKLHIG